MVYDPEKHHRRSIRLTGHDYAADGVYFVTLCAHREFIAASGGKPFDGVMREIIEKRIRVTAEKVPQMQWGEWVIMPDHFHALIYLKAGTLRLGDVVGAFKSSVTREWHRAEKRVEEREGGRATQALPVRRGEAGLGPRIWHRNYYEMIVRSAEAEDKIAEYIRMNPWRCVQPLGNGLRGIGNPALWTMEKLGVLCSRNAPRIGGIPQSDVYFGGWHSPKEKEILEWLLEKEQRIIACPAWSIDAMRIPAEWQFALAENRMLILEMSCADGDLAAAEGRNRFVITHADRLFVPHVSRGGMLESLLKEQKSGES